VLTDYIKKYLKRAALGVAGLALASGAFAQKAELGLTLTKKDGKPAAGIVNIVGSDTTINDKTFLSPKNYVLRNVTGIDDTIIDDKIRAGPNPTYNGNLNIYIQSSNQLEGVITAFDILGKKLGQVDLSQDNYLNFNSKSNLIILEYINKQERQTLKIVNMGNQFNANIIQENIAWEQNQKDKLESSKGALSDDYSVSFTDPTINIENYSKNITVSPGNKVNINEVLDWTAKEIKYSSKTNTNTTIKVIRVSDGTAIDERTVANGIFPVKSLSQRFDNDAGKGIQIKYELTAPYTDPATFTATQFKNQEYKLDTIRNGQFSLTVTGNGTTYTVKSAGATIATKNVGEQTAFKKQGDVVSLELIVSRTGYITETRGVNMNKGLLTQDVQLIPQSAQTYNHVVHGTALSNLSGKTIRNGTSMYLVKAVGDTIWTTTNSGAFSFSWTDLAQNVSVKTGSRNVPGHNQNEITRSIDNDENLSITFTGLTYSLTQPIHVQNQYNEDISSASITGGDATVITNSTGRATVTRSNLQTDANNIPLANYTLSLAITKSNIQTLNTTTVSIAGANSEVLKNVMQEYIYWLRGTNTTPNGATIAGVRDGTTIYTATVSGTTYETNHVTGTTKTQTLNTLTFSAPNYTTQTRTNITLNEGANTIDAQLTPETTSYPHQINGSALSSISGKTIRDGTRIYLTPAPGDTTWTTTSGGSFSFNWTSSVQNQTVKIGSRNVPGHNPREISIAVDDNTNTPITFTGLTYSFTHQVHVQNQYNENVSSASIAGGDATVNTNSSGTATVTRSNLQTDANNLPLANYTTNLTITKSNIQTLNTSITSTTGTNAEALRNVIQEYIYWLRGTNTTPSGASVTGVRDGTTIYTATVSGTTYETNHVTGTTKTQTLNTLTFSAPNYTTQTRTNITLNEGANTIDAQLTPETTSYPHQINGSALSSISGKTIRDGTRIYAVKAVGDTLWTTTSGGSFSFSWTDQSASTSTKVGSRSVPGHNTNEVTRNIDNSESVSVTFTGLTYSLSKPVRVQNQYNENVSSASIEGGDNTETTGTDGRATITRSNLQTDANNLPLSSYTLSLTITKDNIQTKNQNVTATTGTNSESLINVIQEYIYWLYGNNTTPSGATVTGVKDGETLYTATVNGTSFETNHVTGTTKTQTLNTVTFSAPNYTTQTRTNITLNEGANNIEAQLEAEASAQHSFRIRPRTINGDAISSLTLDLTWADGTTTHHSVSGDGYIYVNRTESGEPTTKVKVSHSSSSYNYMQIFRTPDHELADTNYCQTQRFDGNPMYAELNLTDIPYDLVEYLLPRQIKVPTALEGTYGSYINIDAAVIRDMMGGRFSNQTTKFIPRPGAESVYVFQMTFNEDSGVQIEQSQLDRVKTELDKVLSIYTLNDGTHLLPYEFYTISSTSDPKWVEAQARDTFDNVARTTFWNSNAYNGTTLTTTYSINGHARLKNSFSKYNIGTGSPVIFTEIYQQFTNNKDPPEESGAWVTTTTGSVTDFGNAMAKIIYLFNQGTPTD